MFASRTFRMLALAGLVAVLFVGIAGTSAEAGCHSYGYNYVSYKPVHVVKYVPVAPIIKYVQQPYTYPVIQYDCYGLPYTVWLTGYKTVPVKFYQ